MRAETLIVPRRSRLAWFCQPRSFWSVFVLASTMVLAGCNSGGKTSVPAGGVAPPESKGQAAVSSPATSAAPAPVKERSGDRRVVAYYFHRTWRCPTCLSIEKQAREVIETRYAGEITDGLVQWRPVNIQEPGNEHFEQDYKLETSSLIMVVIDNGRQVRWKNLEKVWELVGNSAEFQDYVRSEMDECLGGSPPNG